MLRHSGSSLDNILSSFNNSPTGYNANNLRKEIIELSNREEGFFQNELKNQQGQIETLVDPDIRFITITVDDNFRKQQLVNGIEIQQKFQFQFQLSRMTNRQREILSEFYFENYKNIPKKISLSIPVFNEHSKQIQMQGRVWQANLNPNLTEPLVILSAWEQDFEKGYQEVSQRLESSQKGTGGSSNG